MAWLRQLLRSFGIEEETLEAIVGRIGKELPKHMVPKQRYNALNDSKKQALVSLNDRDERLEKLKAEIEANEARKLQVDKLKQERRRTKDKYESEIRELRLLTALLIAVGGLAAKAEAGQAADEPR